MHNRRAPHTWFFQEKIPNDHLLYVLLQKVEIHIVSLQKSRLIKPRCNHLALGHSKGFSCHLQVFEVNQDSKHIRVFLYQFREIQKLGKRPQENAEGLKGRNGCIVWDAYNVLLRMIHMDEYGKIVARVSEG